MGGMRIALVTAQFAPWQEPHVGGAQVLLADLARGLIRRGHEVAVFAAEGSALAGVPVVETGVDPARLAHTRRRPGSAPAAADPAVAAAFDRVATVIGQGHWDCVHNHAFDAPAITALGRLAIPVLHTLHLPPDADVVGALEDAAASRPVTVAVSESAARAWREVVPLSAVIRNGVPTAEIPWSSSPGAGLVFVGRLSPEKGADVAVRLAERTGLPLTVIGDPYDLAWSALLQHSADRRLVRFLPALPRAAVWVHMGSAMAVLAPARWEEPFGLSVAEAQAAGTPVIVSPRGALPEIVRDGVTGWIADGAEAMEAAVANLHGIERAGCRRHAEAELDLEPMLDAYERAYRDACQRGVAG